MGTMMMAMAWHEGEEKMHRLMHVPEHDNPTVGALSGQAANMLMRAPLIAIGTLDSDQRPWTTIWGGDTGLSQPLGGSMIGVRTPVDKINDPVVNALFGGSTGGEVMKEEGKGRMVGALAIDLQTRKRAKIYGRMVAGAVTDAAKEGEEEEAQPTQSQSEGEESTALVQLVVRVDQSLGNCPKYLNRKEITPAATKSELISKSSSLTDEALKLIDNADLFFVSSSHSYEDMDTNHRGGPPGFLRPHKNEDGSWDLIWPEYSGNRLYQTLGNLQTTPVAGLVIPDFESGNVLYVTGQTEVLVGSDAASVIPRSNLAVRVKIVEARFVRHGLPFRGKTGEPSPYNPKVRPLFDETNIEIENSSSKGNSARLISQVKITPTISRFRFSTSSPVTWKGGQWVALDLSQELDFGYSHMRDEDPESLNDDFIRTFTVSSPPGLGDQRQDYEFEVTVRKVGTVTNLLARQRDGGGLEVRIRGFGGDVKIEQDHDDKITPFVAGGVGITPLLAQLPALSFKKLHLLWTLHIDDINLAVETIASNPGLAKSTRLFVTGTNESVLNEKKEAIDQLKEVVASVEMRRLQKEDLDFDGLSNRWNLCVSTGLRKILLEWLKGKEVIFEDFNF